MPDKPVLKARNADATLATLNPAQAALFAAVSQHVAEMNERGAALQAQHNAKQISEFNPQLLFQGQATYSQRCDSNGVIDPAGAFWRGVRGNLETSVAPFFDHFTVDFVGASDTIIVHFGDRHGDRQAGIDVDTLYPFNRFRLTKQIVGAMRRAGFEHEVTLDVTPTSSRLRTWTTVGSAQEALAALDRMAAEYLSRVGLEGNFHNLFRMRPNLSEIHDNALQDVIRVDDDERATYPDRALLITATRVCRRCRAGLQNLFTDYTGAHPEIDFRIAFTDKPKIRFATIVFEGHCGGVRRRGLATPFVIPYRRGEYCGRFLATRSDEPPPSIEAIEQMRLEFFS